MTFGTFLLYLIGGLAALWAILLAAQYGLLIVAVAVDSIKKAARYRAAMKKEMETEIDEVKSDKL